MQVRIIEFAEETVAALEHRGAPNSLMDSVSSFIEWRKTSKLSPNVSSRTYGIPYSDPKLTLPEDFRFDICGTVRSEVPANAQGVVTKTIPGGRCAVVRHVGSTDAIADSVRPLFAEWLPASGESLRDFPCYFHYVTRMPEVDEHQQITDIYLPLK
jgi:AraC family transcriptional regulator